MASNEDKKQEDLSLGLPQNECNSKDCRNENEPASHNDRVEEDTSQTDSAVEEISETEECHHRQPPSATVNNEEIEDLKQEISQVEATGHDTEVRSRPSSVTSSERSSVSKQSISLENISNQQVKQATHLSQSPQTTASSPTQSVSQNTQNFPYRQGIVWKAGAKLEAMDFMKKWYPAKIVEVDDEDCHVLIHFEGWNQRYDEWVVMTSERLRPLTRHSERKEKRKRLHSKGHRVGEKVLAKWTDCKMYPAKITSILSDDSYEVIFYDGFKRIVQPINIRPLPEELKQPGQRFEISPPDVKDVKKMGHTQNIDVSVRRALPMQQSPTEGKHLKQTSNKEKLMKKKAVRRLKMREKDESIKIRRKKVDSQLDKQKSSMLSKKRKLIVAGSFFIKRAKESNADTEVSPPKQKIPEKKEKVVSVTEKKHVTSVSGKKASTKLCSLPVNQSAGSQSSVSVSSQTPMSVPSSPADSSASEKKPKKRTESPAISEASSESFNETPDSGGRRRSRSLDKDKSHVAVASKAFVIAQDHNPFKCSHEECGKSFRKESLLLYHIKYYHTGNKKQSPPGPPPRKRRKTTSVCSTDSEQSVTSRSRVANAASKRRHFSADGALTPVKMEKVTHVETIVEGEKMTPQKDVTHQKDATHHQKATSNQKDATLKEHKLHSSGKHQRSCSQDTLATEESFGNDTEDELNKDEVVNCICNQNEENGLMIQCEICLCWQHACCFNIKSENLPKKYICFVCENPPGVRDSCRYLYDQDWLKQGELTRFSFLPPHPKQEERTAMLKVTNSLISDMHNIKGVLHGSKCKLKFVEDAKHDEYKLWRRDWDVEMKKEKSDDIEQDTLNDTIPMETENVSIESTVSEMGQEMLNSEMTLDSLGIPMESEVVVSCADLMATPEKDYTEGIVLSDENQSENISQSNSDVATTPVLPAIDTNGAKANLSDRIAKCESASTITSESTVCSNEENSNTDPPGSITKEIKVENEQPIPTASFNLDECPQEISMESNEIAVTETVQEDPFKDCEQNLLKHILNLQSDISSQLDLVEEQVAMLEAAESGVEVTRESILNDMPLLKRSFKTVQADLNKVKRMAAFGS